MRPFEQARRDAIAIIQPLGCERIGIAQAQGRILWEDALAPADMPAFDHSAMDGYAVAVDACPPPYPRTLPVIGESAAGGVAPVLTPGTACRIFTGAPMPSGADAIIIQEDVTRVDDNGRAEIVISSPARRGEWIRRRGQDLAKGETAVPKGSRLGPGAVAMLAATDHAHVAVSRRPVVTILGSGDELRCPGQPAKGISSIAESNTYFVAAAARRCGAHAVVGPFVPDDLEEAERQVRAALRTSDLLITIGGVSVGDHDVMRPALERAGVSVDFWKVAMKPGKPLVVGHTPSTHVLGLPGNPASACLTFLLFGIPIIRALMGDAHPLPIAERIPVRGALSRRPGRTEFLRAILRIENGRTVAELLENQASGALTGFARADALVEVPADCASVADGDELSVLRIDAL